MAPQPTTRWWLTWLLASVLVLAGWLVFERYWRTQGYTPTVMDSNELWAQQRAAVVKDAPPIRVALLGASRIQFGISPTAFKDAAREIGADVSVHMLAINGHYPMAALRDLATDEAFRGIVIVGVDSRGLQKIHREMQAKWPTYYDSDWTPARDLHRSLLTLVQPHAIAARSDFAWSSLLARALNGWGPPTKEYVTFFADRSGLTEYARSNVEAVREARIRDLRDYYANTPAVSPQQWLTDNDVVVEWVKQINARGGRVVFYREPLSGDHLALDEARFPRSEFWDALAARMPATMIDFRDHDSLNVPTPDTSHIDAKDVPRHTRALVRVLAEKRVFARKM
jgi:hypothetical protein